MNASGNRHSRSIITATLLVLACCGWTTQATAQDNSIFSGAGIRPLKTADPQAADAPAAKPWPSLFGRSRPAHEPRLTPAWPKPKLDLFKSTDTDLDVTDEQTSRPTMFHGFPKLFPERDPDRPPFFHDFNERTKALFGRPANDFSGWASGKNEDVRNRTFDTWDSMTRGLKRPFSKASASEPLTQPPVNSAYRFDEKPSVKF